MLRAGGAKTRSKWIHSDLHPSQRHADGEPNHSTFSEVHRHANKVKVLLHRCGQIRLRKAIQRLQQCSLFAHTIVSSPSSLRASRTRAAKGSQKAVNLQSEAGPKRNFVDTH